MRFYIFFEKGYLVVLFCYFLFIEFFLISNEIFDIFDGNLVCVVCNKFVLMIECMKNKFFWVKNVVCMLNFLCLVCCCGCEVSYC